MKQKLLIVDDKPANLFALRSLLHTLDVDVIEAGSGNEALVSTLNHEFALGILDVHMPGMDGYELAAILRDEAATRNMPIIFLSAAFSDDIHVFRGYEAGAVDFITKPYNPDILLSKVQIFLELDLHRRKLQEVIDLRTRDLLETNERLIKVIDKCREAEARYRRLAIVVEQSSDAIMICDTDGKIQYVNSAFEQITGYTAAESMRQTPAMLRSGQTTKAVYKDMWHHMVDGLAWAGCLTNKKKDGSLFEADVRISPVREDGRVTHLVATERDITREADLSRQLRQAQKMEAIGQLAGGVAHDFNNLLTIILGQTQLLQIKNDKENGKLTRNLESIQQAAQRAAMLTRQLLAFSRKQVVRPSVLNVNILIEDLLKMLKRLIGEDVELVTELKAPMPRIKADPGQIEQALMNLVVNARDAMERGGQITISTGMSPLKPGMLEGTFRGRPGDYLVLSVTDTGCGMDKELLGRIFEPFFTTKGIGKGTGLGLAMVYGIVTQFNGHVYVTSEVGKGSTFSLYFPLCSETFTVEKVEETCLTPGEQETILIAEDEDELRALTQEILVAQNYRVLTAADAGEALAKAEQHQGTIHLLLTDVIMPGMYGTDLAKALLQFRPEMRVLFMSGYTDRLSQLDDLHLKQAFLQKPFTPHGLTRKVRDILESDPADMEATHQPA